MDIKQILEKAGHTLPAKKKPTPLIVKAKQPKVYYDLDDDADFSPVGVDGLLAASEKLLAVNRGLVEADERDSWVFKRVYTPDRLMRLRVKMDAGAGPNQKLLQQIARRAARSRTLKAVHPGAFDGYMTGAIIGNPLAMPLEEINPLHIVTQNRRITHMGPGGINTDDAITPEMQNIHTSQFGFISPIEGPECFHPSMQVFTRAGWVDWADVTDSTLFACQLSKALGWRRASKIVHSAYDGPMYAMTGNYVSMCVTPTHEVLYLYRRGRPIHRVTMDKFAARMTDKRLPVLDAPIRGGSATLNTDELQGVTQGKLPEVVFKVGFRTRMELYRRLMQPQRNSNTHLFESELAESIARLALTVGVNVRTCAHTPGIREVIPLKYFAIRLSNPKVTEIKYSGMVHCATVPGNQLLVRGGPDEAAYWSGNSGRAGIDVRMAWGAKIGSDGRIYQKFADRRTKSSKWLSAWDVKDLNLKVPD